MTHTLSLSSVVVAALLASIAASCAQLTPSEEPRAVVRGPLPTRVMLPQGLAFPEPRARSVRTQRRGSFGAAAVLSYASIYEYARVPPDVVELDADLAHVGLSARYGLDAATDIEVELASSFASSGFLDGFVDEFHALFGFPDGDRPARPNDEYALHLAHGGTTVWQRPEDEVEVMDLPVRITHMLRAPEGGLVGVALRAGVELPTGSAARGTGSDGLDYDLGVLFERTRGRWTLTGGVDLVFIDVPDTYRAAGVAPDDLCVGTFGAEYCWDDSTSLLGGLRYRTPFTNDFEIKEIDRPVLDLAFGLARDAGAGRWFAAFHEDVFADSGPDLAVSIGYTLGL